MLLYGQQIGALVRRRDARRRRLARRRLPARSCSAPSPATSAASCCSAPSWAPPPGSRCTCSACSGSSPTGSKYAVAFGVFYGVMELVPYVGPILGALPPVLVALFTDPITAAVGGAAVHRAAAARGPRRRAADLRPHAAHQPAAGDLRAAARAAARTGSSARWWRCRSSRCCARPSSTCSRHLTFEPWDRTPSRGLL